MLTIANEYGNFDMARQEVPKGYRFVEGKRLSVLCKSNKIACVPAITEWKPNRKYPPRPIIGGVIVTEKTESKLLDAIANRKTRDTKRQEQKDRKCLEIGVIPDTPLAKAFLASRVDFCRAAYLAFCARYRHEHTDYEDKFNHISERGDDAREMARYLAKENPVPSNWQEYLDTYDFPFPAIAAKLTTILASPDKAHPKWFCRAVCAIQSTDKDIATYQDICDAIGQWTSCDES